MAVTTFPRPTAPSSTEVETVLHDAGLDAYVTSWVAWCPPDLTVLDSGWWVMVYGGPDRRDDAIDALINAGYSCAVLDGGTIQAESLYL